MVANYVVGIEYLYSDIYNFKKGWIFSSNSVPYAMFRYIKNGSATFIINNKAINVRENQIIYIPEESDLYCETSRHDVSFVSIRFTTAIKLDNLDKLHYNIPMVVDCDDGNIADYFNKIADERNSNKFSKVHKTKGYLELIMAYMLEKGGDQVLEMPQSADRSSMEAIISRNKAITLRRDARVDSVIEYLSMNQTKHIRLDELHKMTGLSASAFRKVFKKHTGKSPKDFLYELRMMNAARMLLSTDDRISDIAIKLQYMDQNYFSRQFKKNFGVTPTEYRNTSF